MSNIEIGLILIGLSVIGFAWVAWIFIKADGTKEKGNKK